MKNIFNIARAQYGLWQAVCLFSVLTFFAPFALSQENEDDEILTPNMTVNIKLNSALSEKETEFYSKIARDIISHIPKTMTLNEQLSKLKEINNKHEHVNIVSYLPATGDVSTDKRIEHFKVKFVFSDEAGARSQEEATIKPTTVGLIKPKSPPETTKPQTSQKPEEMSRADNAEEMPHKKQVDKIEPKKPIKAEQHSQKKTARAPKELPELQLNYQIDETNLDLAHRRSLMKLIHKIRAQGQNHPQAYTFIVRSYNGPSGENTWLAEERLRSVIGLLRQQDIELAHANITEIYVHTNKEQFIKILPIN